ncbi:hypothetical protein [Nitrosomonas aestuarii]|uniref:hypothetical protein n=1 Tax=Nitrosomonas aestuarii TaxID=52441 RepID=UPI000D3234AA|nr:hypothetical protein [Nitrosomonas aestuarii]PTN12504.1 hypothetical protein C8R11_10372 [Nitrosomonas aestuarii]
MAYEIQHKTLGQGWINTWSENGRPVRFPALEEARMELEDYLQTRPELSSDDFRVAEIATD